MNPSEVVPTVTLSTRGDLVVGAVAPQETPWTHACGARMVAEDVLALARTRWPRSSLLRTKDGTPWIVDEHAQLLDVGSSAVGWHEALLGLLAHLSDLDAEGVAS